MGDSESMANALTQIVIDRITERGEIFLTGSSAVGKTFLRVVSANPNAEEKYVRQAWEEIVGTSEEVLKEWKEGTIGYQGDGQRGRTLDPCQYRRLKQLAQWI